MAVHARRGDEAGGRREVAHHLGLDGVDVDRLVHRLAHALVGERVLALDVGVLELGRAHVEAEEDRADLRGLLGLEAGRLLDAGDVLQGRIEHEVDLARDQRGHARRRLLDRRVDQLVGIGREVLGAPVGRVLGHHRLHVGIALLQRVGPGAHGVAHRVGLFLVLVALRLGDVVLLRPRLGHDQDRGGVVGQDGVGPVGDDVHGERIDRLHLLDRGDVGAEVRRRRQRAVVAEGPRPRR